MISLDEMIQKYCDEIERHKTTFSPNRKDYLTFLWSYFDDMNNVLGYDESLVPYCMMASLDKSFSYARHLYEKEQNACLTVPDKETYNKIRARDLEKGLSENLFEYVKENT